MSKIVGKALPDMPWQDKDENDKLPVWRYKANPIIGIALQTRNSNSILTVRTFRLKMDMRNIPLRQQIDQYGYLCRV